MYQFHYYYIKNKYSNNSRLLFTDTDSLMYEPKTDDVHANFSKDKQCLILVIDLLSQSIMIN